MRLKGTLQIFDMQNFWHGMADKPFTVFESVHWMFRLFAYLMEPNKNGNEIEQCFMLRESKRVREERDRERESSIDRMSNI